MLDTDATGMLAEVMEGLRAPQKWLSPKWFYDARGSELFERITELPEYYPTRTETAILKANADRLSGLVPDGGALVEFGSGASVKTRTLLDAGAHVGAYVPIDISGDFLHATASDLRDRYPAIAVHPVAGDFTGPVNLPASVASMPKVAFFPGSTIGNLDPAAAVALLARVRGWPETGAFILGADLVKNRDELIAAYDDAAGVTAAFNLNVLERLNRELGTDFDLGGFRHEARWTGDRIEMHLVSRIPQKVMIGDEVLRFAAAELIHTESSRKYTRDTLSALVGTAEWRVDELLTDPGQRFAVAVLSPKP